MTAIESSALDVALSGASAPAGALAYPYDCVCYITDTIGGQAYRASGVIIGPHTILTAAHVVWDSGLGLSATNVKIYPGLSSSYQTSFSGVAIHYNAVNDANDLMYQSASQNDFAIIDVAQDLSAYGSFAVGVGFAGGQGYISGYPAANGRAQQTTSGTLVADAHYNLIDYSSAFQVSPGSSGGPIWINEGTASNPIPKVVGLVSTGSWGALLTAADLTQIQGWIAQDAYLFNGAGLSGHSPTVRDYNGDGFADVLFREPSTGAWGYAGFSGSGAWHWAPQGGSTASYSVVGEADFNGDGVSDILFREGSSGNWGFAAMSASGGWSWAYMGGSTASYNEVQAGDFNGDGVADIAFREGSTGNWGIASMNYGGSYSWTPMGGSTASYSMVGNGDYNGDGTSDLLFRDNHTGAWGIAFMNTHRGYNWVVEGASTASYSVVGSGDFNGDGVSDILFRENATGNWGYAAMNHAGAWAWVAMGGSTQSYTVASVGDYNADGFSDIAFRENATGAWGVAQMHGATYAWLAQGGSTQDYLGY